MDLEVDDLGRISLSHRFERTMLGEVLVSVFVAVTLIIAVVWNLPDSYVKRSAQPVLRPLATVAGTDQVWSMYAPDPIRRREVLEIHVIMADGSDRMWSFTQGDRIVGQFSWYHWQKLKEQAIREPGIRAGFAMWVVRRLTMPGEQPVHVEMILRASDRPPPGQVGLIANEDEMLYSADIGDRS